MEDLEVLRNTIDKVYKETDPNKEMVVVPLSVLRELMSSFEKTQIALINEVCKHTSYFVLPVTR